MNDYLDVGNFVLNAHDIIDETPANGEGEGDEGNGQDIPDYKKKRVLAGFYKRCAVADHEFDEYGRDNIQKYLQNKIGPKDHTISDADWEKIELIRSVTKALYCPAGGIQPKY